MSFIWPAMLASLLLLPALALLYLRVERRRREVAARYGAFGAPRAAAGAGPGVRRHIPAALFLAALAILCLAMARPQAAVSLPRLEGTVVLAFDVSGSMAAADLQPTRMEAAKAAAAEFVRRQPATARVGVVAFSDGGLAVQPPTSDQELLTAAIGRLRPERGTSVGEGLLAALTLIDAESRDEQFALGEAGPAPTPQPLPPGTYVPAVILLLSDGENNAEPDPLAVAAAAAERGVRIYTVGLGSPAGATLEIDGFSVFTQLDETSLRQIAELTGGAYFPAQQAEDLPAIYDEVAAQLVVRAEQTEITALFAGVSLALLLAGGLCSFLWFNRLA